MCTCCIVYVCDKKVSFSLKRDGRRLNNNVTAPSVFVGEGESQVLIIAFIIIHEKPWNLFSQHYL